MNISAVCTDSMYQASENYLRTEFDLVENDIRFVLDEYTSNFLT